MRIDNGKLELIDKNGMARIRLEVDEIFGPYLSLNDAKGLERIKLTLTEKGDGFISIMNADGQGLVSLGAYDNLTMTDTDGQLVSLGSSQGITIMDAKADNRIGIHIRYNKGEIELETKDGIHSWPKESE